MNFNFLSRKHQYKHIFFDLDRTVWDFERNKDAALIEMFDINRLSAFFDSASQFISIYTRNNDYLWEKYRKNELTKDVLRFKRFDSTLKDVGVDNIELAKKLGDDYLRILPQKNALIEGTKELLEYLAPKYALYILSNGFREVQSPKLERSGIRSYFRWVITSEQSGYHKPDKRAFGYALSKANAKKLESIMIGDDIDIDIVGAKQFGIDQIFFNPLAIKHNYKFTFEVGKLLEIKKIL